MLKEILLSENVLKSINDYLEYILTIIPELKSEIGFDQKHPHHHLDVWNHTLLALSLSECDYIVRTALLLHDIGKPFSYQEGSVRHFKGHALKSSIMAESILKRLDYSKEDVSLICSLIKDHDTKIDINLIDSNYDYYKKLYEIQKCDALAHHPEKLEKRIEYLSTLEPYFNEISLYRLCNQKEIESILKTRSLHDVGSLMVTDYRKNNFDYTAGVRYLHFFKKKEDILYLNCSKGKYICTYHVPEKLVMEHSGFGKYLDSMFLRDLKEVEEVALPNFLVDYNYLEVVERLIDDYDIDLEYQTKKIMVKSLNKA